MTMLPLPQIADRLIEAERAWLFLDYDGTLDDFAPTPDHITPNPDVIDLVERLVRLKHLRVGVISGRRLSHIQALLPVPGLLTAGTYGLELQLPDGERLDRLTLDEVRPTLEVVKPRWAQLIVDRRGFYLEDKAWALALHARFADAVEAEDVLALARQSAADLRPGDRFRLLGGDRFLEIAPGLANKGRTVEYLLDRGVWPGAVPFYIGDDDKDEEAFAVVRAHQGMAICVAAQPRETAADGCLPSPADVRYWLAELVARWQAAGR
jgi:trehalose 6-phosphate phosphatase